MKKVFLAAALIGMTVLSGCASYDKETSNTQKFAAELDALSATDSYYITVGKDITNNGTHESAVFSCYYDGDSYAIIKQKVCGTAPDKDYYTGTITSDGQSTDVNYLEKVAQPGVEVPNLSAYSAEQTATLYATVTAIYETAKLSSVKTENSEIRETFKSGNDTAIFVFDESGNFLRLELPADELNVVLTFESGTDFDKSVFDIPEDFEMLGE